MRAILGVVPIQAQRGSPRPGHELGVSIQLEVPVCHVINGPGACLAQGDC
jgi:hypothetical protein